MKKFFPPSPLLIDLVVLAMIGLFLLGYFQPGLLLLKTTINGGDTGSHYPTAVMMKELFLPQGRLMGWDQGNYAGYPLFYHYFPLPFLLMALLSFLIPLEISFKLVSVLGIFLLPLAVYLAFRAMKYRFPVPVIAAVFSLAFLFNQGNSMWGGNIPSTLAGEFCYSIGLAFVFLFLGTLYRGVAEQRYLVWNALLILLISASHAYALIFALVIGSFFFFDDPRRNFKYLAAVYGLGFLFQAGWLLPVLATLPYVTSFVFRWTIHSLLEVFVPILLPFMALSLVSFFLNLRDHRTRYFLYLVLACVFIYLVGPRVGVLDIRFVPFFQLLLAVFGAAGLLQLLGNLKLTIILPLVVFLLGAVWVDLNTTYIRHWIQWNYSGYEQKSTWPVFKGINDFLRASGDSRVQWEHSPMDEALGSIRTYETLPYFAGRQTLEGIHMLGAISAPFIFYIESETSYQACNPIPDYHYSTLDLRRGIDHFKLFNVGQFVVRSPEVKREIRRFPEFRLEKTVGEYEVHRLLTNNEQYVEPLQNRPVVVQTDRWRDLAYRWFTAERLKDTFLIMGAGEGAIVRGADVITDLDQVKTIPYPKKNITVTSKLGPESIDIETSEIGHPLLIKVSYHPNWRVEEGAEQVYFVTPCFMLVYPTAHHVRLTFGPRGVERFGLLLSLFGLLMAGASPYWFKYVRSE